MLGSSNGHNGQVSGESSTHVVGIQRDDFKATLPVPASSADENEDDDGDDILIRRSASGVFRYSSPAISNTAHLCFNKCNTERLQREGHSHSDEHYDGHQGEMESQDLRQGQGSCASLMQSRQNLDPENTGRANDSRIRPMPAKVEGINSVFCTRGSSVDILQHAENDREFSQVNISKLKSTYILNHF